MVHDPYNRFRPKGDPWLLRDHYQGGLNIRYFHIYIHEVPGCWVEKLESKKYHALVFFPSGHLLAKAFDDFDDISEDKFLFNSQVGFFTERNGFILTEQWAAINLGQTGFSLIEIQESGDLVIISVGNSIRRQIRHQEPQVYSLTARKVLLDFQPDW